MAAMSHLSHLAVIDRPDSRVSLARSDTTYHSFQDIEMFEHQAPCPPSQISTVHPSPVTPSADKEQEEMSFVREMRRQDSGYESIAPRDHRTSSSSPSPTPSTPRPHYRRSHTTTQRTPRPRRTGRHSVSPPASSSRAHQQVTYFHFPHFTSSDPALHEQQQQHSLPIIALPGFPVMPTTAPATPTPRYPPRSSTPPPPATSTHHPLPPPTTHYWTSDRTRRLEYAAIDAASKGVRGWIIRHVVPDCFVPPSKRRVGFEDDRGSVVRYRLELDQDCGSVIEKAESVRMRGFKGWWFSMRRR